jgi:hypothetical protein
MNVSPALGLDSREDFPRVSVDTLQGWQHVENSCTRAALARLEEQTLANGLSEEKESIMSHFTKVTLAR